MPESTYKLWLVLQGLCQGHIDVAIGLVRAIRVEGEADEEDI